VLVPRQAWNVERRVMIYNEGIVLRGKKEIRETKALDTEGEPIAN
jgi:hypothetical protein